MAAKLQILQQSNSQKDSTSADWNKLPFIQNTNDNKLSIIIDTTNVVKTATSKLKTKKKTTVLVVKAELDTSSVDSLSQSIQLSDSIIDSTLAIPNQGSIQPSFFKGHALKANQNEPIGNAIANPDWFTIMIMLLVIAFTYIQYSYSKVFRQLLNAFFNNNVTNQIIREENVMVQRASITLSIIYYLAGGLFLYQLSDFFHWEISSLREGFSRFLIFSLALAFVSPVKMIILKVLGFIFESDYLASVYSFNIFLINNMLGLIIIPLIILFAYLPFNTGYLIPYLGIGLSLLAFLYRVAKGYSLWNSKGQLSPLYFILYLCTLEIAPILILLKYTTLVG